MADALEFGSGVVLHVESLSEHEDLVQIVVQVNGTTVQKTMSFKNDVGTGALSALAQGLSLYGLSSSSVHGALAWAPVTITKQEAGQLKKVVLFLWSIARVFLHR